MELAAHGFRGCALRRAPQALWEERAEEEEDEEEKMDRKEWDNAAARRFVSAMQR